jgi:hypothetical protein
MGHYDRQLVLANYSFPLVGNETWPLQAFDVDCDDDGGDMRVKEVFSREYVELVKRVVSK